ncbi:hypothetical protein [Bauldia sp.]|uniref:hypothetical protein n=1 Tax=Bauldia sp. TaxID=2575872 RepID=UPI003BAD4E1E
MTVRISLAVASLVLLSPATAQSQESTTAAALRAMVSDLDATPEWSARFTSLSFNSTTDTATVDGLVIRSEEPGTELNFDTITVTGFAEATDGTITVDRLATDGGTVIAGFSRIGLTDLEVEGLSVPVLDPVVFSAEQPIISLMKVYSEALKIDIARASAAEIDVIQTLEGVESRVAYEQVSLEDFADGKIARMDAAAARMEAPVEDQLMTIRIGVTEGRDLDLGAFVHVYDPDAYQNGRGDMVWRNASGYVAYRDIVVDAPGARVFIDLIEAEDLNVRQPPQEFTTFLDAVTLDPNMPEWRIERMAKQAIPDMLGAWSIGVFRTSGIEVDMPGVDRVALDDFIIRDLSIDGMREFSFAGLEFSMRGAFATRVDSFAIGNMVFGGIDGLKRLIATFDAGGEPDPNDVIPVIGFMELVGFDLQTPDVERLSLDRLRVDSSDYIGIIPTVTTMEMEGLVVPTDVMDREARLMMQRFGYDQLNVAMTFGYEWADELLSIAMTLGSEGMGSMAFDMEIGGVPLSLFDGAEIDISPETLPDATFVEGRFAFTDEAIVGHGLELLAEEMNAPKDQIRSQFADALPFFISMGTAGNPEVAQLIRESGFLDQLTPAIREFIAAPGGSIIFEAKPAAPVPFSTLEEVGDTAPERMIDLLAVSVASEPAPTTEVEATPRPTPESGAATEDTLQSPPQSRPE